ncbi:hypothetical protein ABFX02_04G042500 [Erythranthe guttata]
MSMDLTPLRCLNNSISRLIHLVTCRISTAMPAEKDYINLVSLLKLVKPVLDDIANRKAPLDEALSKECDELDTAVNEAREFLEKWSPKTSKILCVLQSKPLVLKIQNSSVKLCGFCESSPNAQICIQESRNVKLGQLSEHIEEILKSQKDWVKNPSADHLTEIIESFSLRSSQELLNERIALEKEKQKAEPSNIKSELDRISQILELISHIREFVEKNKSVNNVQIPSYFRCPLSLELMWDPVIVASGQTYERAHIQKWLDQGLVRCPKTNYELAHKNLIPNYTVKALIVNWCNENKVELSDNSDKVEDVFEARKVPEEGSVQSSPEHSYVHSRSESASSAVSSIDYASAAPEIGVSRMSVNYPFTPPNGGSPSLSGKFYNSSKTISRMLSFPSDSLHNELTSTPHVEKLVNGLRSLSTEVQTASAGELRFLAKYNIENRVIIGQCGAIAPLISLLHSDNELIQEHSVTALLNLSIDENIKSRIAEEGALEPLIHVLKTGNTGAKENAAAALFSISLLDDYRVKIGRSGAVNGLVDLLKTGSVRGKKDAATALFNLSIFHENKARIVQAGAVKYLVGLMEPCSEMVDKAVALLANLSTIVEGCSAIAREGGIPLLVEIVDMGSQRGKENAASILLQMCINNSKYCRSVLQEGAVPPLVALSQSGTPRAKEKAQQLLSHFRNQRESAVARGRS